MVELGWQSVVGILLVFGLLVAILVWSFMRGRGGAPTGAAPVSLAPVAVRHRTIVKRFSLASWRWPIVLIAVAFSGVVMFYNPGILVPTTHYFAQKANEGINRIQGETPASDCWAHGSLEGRMPKTSSQPCDKFDPLLRAEYNRAEARKSLIGIWVLAGLLLFLTTIPTARGSFVTHDYQ